MYPLHRHVGALLLSATLLAQATSACAVRGETRILFSDQDREDWHTWKDHEDRVFRVYLGERHEGYRDFRSLNDGEKSEY